MADAAGVPTSSGRADRFARNLGWNMLGQIGIGAISFLCVPVLVRHFGVESYGLYILLYAASNYLSLATFGSANSTVKYLAQFKAEHNVQGVRGTMKYALFMHVAGSLLTAGILGFGARFWAVRLFHIPPPLVEKAVFILRCAATGGVSLALIQYSNAVMQGLQRFDWQNILAVGQSGLMPLGAVLLVAAGFGLRGVSAWYVLLNTAVALASLIVIRRLLHFLKEPGGRGKFPRKDFFLYGLSVWLGPLAWIVTFQLDKVFIARATSLTALTLYAVPSGLLQRLQSLPTMVASVVMPMMSEMKDTGDEETLIRIYLKSVRFLLWAVLPVLVFLFALIPQFLTLWLGGQFGDRSVWPARLLVVAQVFISLNFIPHSLASARGKPSYVTAVSWGQAVISVLAWHWLLPRYDILGVAIGSLLAQVIPAFFYLWAVHRNILGIGFARYFAQSLWRPFLCAGILLAVVFPIHRFGYAWEGFLAIVVGGGLIYCAAAWLLLDADDRWMLHKVLAGASRRLGLRALE
jgi:O-antigen/teichoic acid export membrane protein